MSAPNYDPFDEAFRRIFGVNLMPDITPPLRPDDLDVIQMNNEAIEEVRDSQERAEITGELPRMDYGRIADREAAEKGAHDDDRR